MAPRSNRRMVWARPVQATNYTTTYITYYLLCITLLLYMYQYTYCLQVADKMQVGRLGFFEAFPGSTTTTNRTGHQDAAAGWTAAWPAWSGRGALRQQKKPRCGGGLTAACIRTYIHTVVCTYLPNVPITDYCCMQLLLAAGPACLYLGRLRVGELVGEGGFVCVCLSGYLHTWVGS